MDGTVIVSDGAGQFNIAQHALCWVHAERLIHKLDTFCVAHVRAKELIRHRIWWGSMQTLKAYRQAPTSRRASELRRRFSRIFSTTTGFAALDRVLARLNARKKDLLAVLKRPEIPLHTNGSENDIRCQVTRRKISAGTRSDPERDCRDGFLGLMKTCAKHAVRSLAATLREAPAWTGRACATGFTAITQKGGSRGYSTAHAQTAGRV